MLLSLLLACTGSPAADSATDTDAPVDTGTDTGTADTADTADTAADGTSYRGATHGTLDTEIHYDCVGFAAFTLHLDGSVSGDAEAHCSLAEDASVFQHVAGPIEGAQVDGVFTGTWTATLCGAETTIPLTGTTSAAAVEATATTPAPCALLATLSAD